MEIAANNSEEVPSGTSLPSQEPGVASGEKLPFAFEANSEGCGCVDSLREEDESQMDEPKVNSKDALADDSEEPLVTLRADYERILNVAIQNKVNPNDSVLDGDAPKEKELIACSEVLESLLEQIKEVNFGEIIGLPEGQACKQRCIVIGTIQNLLNIARTNNWHLAKVNGLVYIYNNAYWEELEREGFKTFLKKCSLKMGGKPYEVNYHAFSEDLLKQFNSEAHFSFPKPDPAKICINLQNGTFEFKGQESDLRSFHYGDFLTYILPFKYNQDAKCPLFENYLNKVLPEKESQMALGEFCGSVFTSMNLEKCLMLLGDGSNGKSVFFEILTALVGEKNVLTFSLGDFKEPSNRAKLQGKLLNYSSEKGADLAPELFKALISGEPVQARRLYEQPFELRNTAKFVLNANSFPKDTESTHAYFRRYLIILFSQTISEAEQDTKLADKIIANELSGVFLWVLEGLKRLVKNGNFTQSEASKKALEDFKKLSDSVALFIEENRFKPEKSIGLSLKSLYPIYKSFCIDNNYRCLGKTEFSKSLEKKGFEKKRHNAGFYFMMDKAEES